MLRSCRFRAILVLSLTLSGFQNANTKGQTINEYRGPVGPPENLWSDPANWDAGVEPNDTHHVVIPYAATTVMDLPYTSDFGTKILSLSVAGGGAVDLEG